MNGSIRRRSANSWELTLDMGREASGRRKRKFVTVRGTKAEAQRHLRELLSGMDRGLTVNTSKGNVSRVMWLNS